MALSPTILSLIRAAIAEDVGSGDVTTNAIISAETQGRAQIIAKQRLIVCGQEVAAAVFHELDPKLSYQAVLADKSLAADGSVLANISGSMRSILSGERVALNFLQRLSGVATTTHKIAAIIASSGVKLLDTRKTTPGWRELEKYAVLCGGGTNHRIGLFDQVLIKNNHIDAAGGDIGAAIAKCRASSPNLKIEVEVRNFAELHQALAATPDIILLDNMTTEELEQAVEVVKNTPGADKIMLEASGGITEKNIQAYANTGIHALSLGMLTHSAQAVDISLRYQDGTV